MTTNKPYMPKSKSTEWETPDWLFNQLNEEFEFTVDAAASKENKKLDFFWSKEKDGLKQSWAGERVWVNPPWGADDLRAWTENAWQEANLNGVTTVMLVPVKADQDWWHLYALRAERRFIPGRVYFGDSNGSYPGPVAVLVFGPGIEPYGKTLVRSDR